MIPVAGRSASPPRCTGARAAPLASRAHRWRAALGPWLALLTAAACERGEAGATAESAPPLVCPRGASVQRVEFRPERGGGFAERCVLPDGTSRHGPSREWNAEGRPLGVTHWWQGMRHGKTTFWYPSGQKSHEAEHYRWQAVGRWTSWDEQGTVIDQQDFGPPDPSAGAWPRPELGEPPGTELAPSAQPGASARPRSEGEAGEGGGAP